MFGGKSSKSLQAETSFVGLKDAPPEAIAAKDEGRKSMASRSYTPPPIEKRRSSFMSALPPGLPSNKIKVISAAPAAVKDTAAAAALKEAAAQREHEEEAAEAAEEEKQLTALAVARASMTSTEPAAAPEPPPPLPEEVEIEPQTTAADFELLPESPPVSAPPDEAFAGNTPPEEEPPAEAATEKEVAAAVEKEPEKQESNVGFLGAIGKAFFGGSSKTILAQEKEEAARDVPSTSSVDTPSEEAVKEEAVMEEAPPSPKQTSGAGSSSSAAVDPPSTPPSLGKAKVDRSKSTIVNAGVAYWNEALSQPSFAMWKGGDAGGTPKLTPKKTLSGRIATFARRPSATFESVPATAERREAELLRTPSAASAKRAPTQYVRPGHTPIQVNSAMEHQWQAQEKAAGVSPHKEYNWEKVDGLWRKKKLNF